MPQMFAHITIWSAQGLQLVSSTVLLPLEISTPADAYEGAMRVAQAAEVSLLKFAGQEAETPAALADFDPDQLRLL